MNRRDTHRRTHFHPLVIALAVIVVSTTLAIGVSGVEGGILGLALERVAALPGFSWVASWISQNGDRTEADGGDLPGGTNGAGVPGTGGIVDDLLAGVPPREASLEAQRAEARNHRGTVPQRGGPPNATPIPTEDPLGLAATPTRGHHESPTETRVDEPTPTPTKSYQPTTTPTPTEVPETRFLSLSSASVDPGENFEVDLVCDNTEGVAGCDIGLTFEPQLVDLVTVHKTDLTEPFMLVKRKDSGTFVLSLAGIEGLPSGGGPLVSFEGVAAATSSGFTESPVCFIKARMYDTDSQPFNVQTKEGLIRIGTEPSQSETLPTQAQGVGEEATPAPTDFVSSDPGEETQPGEVTDPTLVPEASEPSPLPLEVGDGGLLGSSSLSPVSVGTAPSATPTGSANEPSATAAAGPTSIVFQADLNQDGEVDRLDILEFIRNWKTSLPAN